MQWVCTSFKIGSALPLLRIKSHGGELAKLSYDGFIKLDQLIAKKTGGVINNLEVAIPDGYQENYGVSSTELAPFILTSIIFRDIFNILWDLH